MDKLQRFKTRVWQVSIVIIIVVVVKIIMIITIVTTHVAIQIVSAIIMRHQTIGYECCLNPRSNKYDPNAPQPCNKHHHNQSDNNCSQNNNYGTTNNNCNQQRNNKNNGKIMVITTTVHAILGSKTNITIRIRIVQASKPTTINMLVTTLWTILKQDNLLHPLTQLFFLTTIVITIMSITAIVYICFLSISLIIPLPL
jgi:hypothetical protein